jgi:ATP-binding cassette subfamily B protein
MRRLLAYVRPYWALVAGALVLLFTEGALQLVGPLLTRRVIDVALPARDLATVRASALLLALALLLQFACSYGETLLTSLLGQRVMRDLRRDIFARLQRLAISAAMVLTDWRLALASFAVIPFVYLTSHVFRVKVRDAYRAIRTRLARINAFLQERLSGMRVVQLFGREASERRRFDALNRDHLEAHLRSITVYALYFPAIEILTSVALAVLIVAASARVHAGTLTVGTVAAFLQLLRRFFQPLQDLSEKYNILQQAMAASERIFKLLDTEAGSRVEGRGSRRAGDAEAAFGGRSVPGGVSTLDPRPSSLGVTVAFEDVWFAYDLAHLAAGQRRAGGEPEWVLKGISFVARPGETVALVGHTGAGKTTVVNLLLRFYEPQRGRITIDGVDIREMPVDELRRLIGYVQQDIFLFAGDVATNIRLSTPLGDAEVEEAARRVGADRIVRRLPGGYAHVLGERGASISVGERQLLSFARAIAADPALLLLDEATSAVDSEIEAEIQRALAVLMRGRTTIAIAHRLSTIVGADEILVIHHGQIRERGTHRDLLARGGLYERLYRLQAGMAESLARAAG